MFLLNPPLSFGEDLVGYYLTEYMVVRIFGALCVVPFYKGRKNDWNWQVVAVLSAILLKALLSIPYYNIGYVFFGKILQILCRAKVIYSSMQDYSLNYLV